MLNAFIRICTLGLCLGSLAILANCSEPTAEADPAAGRKPVVSGIVEPPVCDGIPNATAGGTPEVSIMAGVEWANAVSFELGNNVPLRHFATLSIEAFRETVGTQVRVGARLRFSHPAQPGPSGSFHLNASGLRSLIAAIDELDAVRFDPRPKTISRGHTWLKWNNVILQKDEWGMSIWDPGSSSKGGYWGRFTADQLKEALSKAIDEIDSLAKTPSWMKAGK